MSRNDNRRGNRNHGWNGKDRNERNGNGRSEQNERERDSRSAKGDRKSRNNERNERRSDRRGEQRKSFSGKMNFKEIQENENAIRTFKENVPVCEICGQPISDISSALSNKND